uniref:CCHC-type domain-containing protein n=1 Tax=Lepisosteus oculatus TaxID=7918 RepID=W5MI73_LEPOC
TEKYQAKMKSEALKNYNCTGLLRDDMHIIMLNLYDPFIPEVDVTTFLCRYLDVQKVIRRIGDKWRIWNGKTQFLVTLRRNNAEADGFDHPPAIFTIGSGRRYLFYRGQPSFCRKCWGVRHTEADCPPKTCRKCGQEGHLVVDCKADLVCNLCGKLGHLYRACPNKARSFASVAS